MSDFWIALMPLFFTTPLAVAAVVIFTRRQRHREAPTAQLEGQVEELKQELALLRQELTEAQERLDFAERMLAQEARPPAAAA
jgi:uncharacterized protein YceH (UPF0502 family)